MDYRWEVMAINRTKEILTSIHLTGSDLQIVLGHCYQRGPVQQIESDGEILTFILEWIATGSIENDLYTVVAELRDRLGNEGGALSFQIKGIEDFVQIDGGIRFGYGDQRITIFAKGDNIERPVEQAELITD